MSLSDEVAVALGAGLVLASFAVGALARIARALEALRFTIKIENKE